jgi:hypothetical protein
MKCTLQKPQAQWTDFGRRAAAAGLTVEAVISGLKHERAREWATAGYEAQTKRMARKAKKEPEVQLHRVVCHNAMLDIFK